MDANKHLIKVYIYQTLILECKIIKMSKRDVGLCMEAANHHHGSYLGPAF